MAASAKSRRACGPSFVFLASARSCDALKSPRNATGIDMTNLHRSPPMNQSKTDLGTVNESQLLRFGISTNDQNLEIQETALKAAGCGVIRAEKRSGTTTSGRAELQTVLDFLSAGDVLMVTRIDRLARSKIGR